MYVYQNGKPYVKTGDVLVGVDIHSNKCVTVKNTETKLEKEFSVLTASELRAKFNVTEDSSYKFPRPVSKAVENDDSTGKTRKTKSASTRGRPKRG